MPLNDQPTAGEYYTYLNEYVIPEYYSCAIGKDKLIKAVSPKKVK